MQVVYEPTVGVIAIPCQELKHKVYLDILFSFSASMHA